MESGTKSILFRSSRVSSVGQSNCFHSSQLSDSMESHIQAGMTQLAQRRLLWPSACFKAPCAKRSILLTRPAWFPITPANMDRAAAETGVRCMTVSIILPTTFCYRALGRFGARRWMIRGSRTARCRGVKISAER
jgi:hypothetical protein